MMHDRNNSRYFTKAEALALVGKSVNTNAGCVVTITGLLCEGPDAYSVMDAQGYGYAKCCNNGLYCWA